jgi:hypothetical protein
MSKKLLLWKYGAMSTSFYVGKAETRKGAYVYIPKVEVSWSERKLCQACRFPLFHHVSVLVWGL